MSTVNVQILKTAIMAEVAQISDELDKAEATVLADRYCDALDSQTELEAGGIQSYTIAGRTITRFDPGAGTSLVNEIRAQLYQYIRGGISYISMGGIA